MSTVNSHLFHRIGPSDLNVQDLCKRHLFLRAKSFHLSYRTRMDCRVWPRNGHGEFTSFSPNRTLHDYRRVCVLALEARYYAQDDPNSCCNIPIAQAIRTYVLFSGSGSLWISTG